MNIVTVAGIKFINTNVIRKSRVLDREYEVEYQDDAIAQCKNALVFDLGACVGIFGFPAAITARSVILIEPYPFFISYMKTVTEINEIRNTVIEPIAIGPETGITDLYVEGSVLTPATSFMGFSKNKARTKVLMTTFDAIVEKYGIPDLIKVDIEGDEIYLLNQINLRKVKHVFLELHETMIEMKGLSKAQMLLHLSDLGFIINKRYKQTHVKTDIENFWLVNSAFVR